MNTGARAALLALAGLGLAACGVAHPGAAAVVDGDTIPMSALDRAAEAYCELTVRSAAAAQGATTVDNAEVRRQAVIDLVSVRVARQLAEREGITTDESTFRLTPAQVEEVATAFPDNTDDIVSVLEDSQEIFAVAVALGEQETGETATEENQAQLAEAGRAIIVDAFADHDVEFSPRFALEDTAEPAGTTGSLSASTVDFEAPTPEELPAEQRCG
jgi:hypothetical protein